MGLQVLLLSDRDSRRIVVELDRELGRQGALVSRVEYDPGWPDARPRGAIVTRMLRRADLVVLVIASTRADLPPVRAWLDEAESLLRLVGRDQLVVVASPESAETIARDLSQVRLFLLDDRKPLPIAELASSLRQAGEAVSADRPARVASMVSRVWKDPWMRALFAFLLLIEIGALAWTVDLPPVTKLTIVGLCSGLVGAFLTSALVSAERRRNETDALSELQALRSLTERELVTQRHAMTRLAESVTAFADPLSEKDLRGGSDAQRPAERRAGTASPADPQPLLREIAHALNTPLSQIEAAALNLSEGEALAMPEDRETLNRIFMSLGLCKVFLDGYAQLSSNGSSAGAERTSFSGAVAEAAELYRRKSMSSAELRFDGPPDLTGYPTELALAVSLPLLENAFESATPGSTIAFDVSEAPEAYTIEISNAAAGEPDFPAILRQGYTTKPGHSGLGLPMVQRLVESRAGCVLTHRWDGDRVTFGVTLARGG